MVTADRVTFAYLNPNLYKVVKNKFSQRVDDKSSNHLLLMKERDARYKLYFENLELHLKLKEFDGSAQGTSEVAGDPVILRIALDKCR